MTTTKPTALITGASKGFGLALAKALGQRGWKLIINARNAGRTPKGSEDARAIHRSDRHIRGCA
jgi:NAD(P)-dependent dehydrogenase (short-subunit alcohol dehydrogenase family)